MTYGPVAAIVLAAGGSTRLGQPKQLLPVGQTPLLQCTLDMVRRTALAPRILVIGGYADEILEAVNAEGFTIVRNSAFRSGQASSLRSGLAHVPDDAPGAAIILGDQPLVPAWLVDELAAAFDPDGSDIAVRPCYAEGPGNPVVLGRRLFPELLSLQGDVGARDVLRRHTERVHEIDYPHLPAPRDVDTPDDYEALLLDWSSTGAPDMPRYCQRCGSPVGFREIHNRLRPVCPTCGFTYYYDPKIAVAVVVEIEDQVVLQRRAIDPGRGRWTFPGGFVDRGEVVAEAAVREVREEVGIDVDDLQLVGVYSQPGETIVVVGYGTRVSGQVPVVSDDESTDVGLFPPDALPPLAFPRNQRIVDDWLRLTASSH